MMADKRARVRTKIETVITEIFNGGNRELIPEIYTEDCVFKDSAAGFELKGHDALRALMDAYEASLPDQKYELVDIVYGESDGERDQLAMHWKSSGTHSSELWGQPATGRRFEIEAVSLVELRDERIASVKQIWDVGDFCEQVGIERPPGPHAQARRQVLRQWFDEVWNQNAPLEAVDATVDRMWGPTAEAQGVSGVAIDGRDTAKAAIRLIRSAFEDIHFELSRFRDVGHEVSATAVWTMTHRATGKRVQTEMLVIATIRDGQFVGGKNVIDFLDVLTQVEALPADTLPALLQGAAIQLSPPATEPPAPTA